jgi:hypothetical protein
MLTTEELPNKPMHPTGFSLAVIEKSRAIRRFFPAGDWRR